ncbi:immunoglobulin-binding protein 1 isoform 2-T2 [Clarias gariepinus]|uniref:immunoglobulin-binding protein 1 isoform X2 n=1 Tax=Clarias gariepinus TaxID=13013 RepID=UPI00234D1D56|nr:immunoglobulin-binding protein 1 isoform X2 [Clarias gariepinus]
MACAEEREQTPGAPPPRLADLLESGWKLYEELERSDEPTNSDSVQVKIKRGVKQLEEAAGMVSQIDLFSRNEELDEISTADLKFLLLPALLAALLMKQVGVAQRLERVQTARAHLMNFLRRCKDYNISSFHMPRDAQGAQEETASGAETDTASPAHQAQPDLIAMATQRQAKIERYKQQKQTEQKLAELRALLDGGSVDEEVTREFYLLQVRRWITLALEEVESIDQEVQILRMMPALNQAPVQKPRRAPMKPFILTKDAAQAKVFGAGYPSLATMTVNDWYEQHRRRGCLPDQGIPQSTGVDAEEREKEEKERKEEEDDEEALQKARDWDNWKDTHRRGYGNRQNMG